MTGRRIRTALTAASVMAAGGVALGVAPAAQAATPTVFSYTGAEQTYVVPANVQAVDVVAVGGKGGAGASSGGFGASVGAILPVTAGEVLYVEVGGNGSNSGLAVFNGGGAGGSGGGGTGGSGGGASGVQTLSGFGAAAQQTRLLVAGGGGGGGGAGSGNTGGAAGQAGSATTTTAGIEAGQPGTASAGGAGGSGAFGGSNGTSGFFANGGSGGAGAAGAGGGGGGGGWYGGGGGGGGGGVPAAFGNAFGAGGGGGANFVESSATNPQISTDSSGTPSVTIAPEPAVTPGAPTLTLVSSKNPAFAGDPVTFSATLDPAPTCGTVSWTIDGAPPASGIPSSTTSGTFSLGPVSNLSVGSHPVTFSYSGCGAALATSGSLTETINPASAQSPPVITAQVTSAHAKHHGWYRSPVHVSFTCTAGSAPLNTSCPGPITLSKSRADQSVTATITDSAGRTGSVTVSGIDIDRVPPTLRVTGAANGATYRHGRHQVCHASDALSGVVSCRIHKHRSTRHGLTTVRWSATATDDAGNSTSKSGHFFIAS